MEGPLLNSFFSACPVAAPPSVKKRRATVHKSRINGLIRKTEQAFQRLESRFPGPLHPLFLPQVQQKGRWDLGTPQPLSIPAH